MESMLSPDENYPFDKIKIKTPKALQGGTYCANLEVDNSPLIIQTPKCKTKNGIHRTAKQIYCDLVLDRDHQAFLDWMEKLQDRVRNLILENSSKWFHESPSMDEIEYNWNDSIRTRKDYYLIRSFVHKPKGISKVSLQIFDTDENQLNIDQVDSNKNVICILEIIGLKFSSNSFHLEICLRQMMVINEKPLFNKCLIKLDSKKNNGEKLVEKEELVTENLENNVENKTKKEEIEENQETEVSTVINNLVDTTESNENNEEVENKENVEELSEVVNNVEKEKVDEDEKQEVIEEPVKPLEKNDDLEEIELNITEEEPMRLKEPNEVYLDIYKQAREKARKAKNEAIKAYLEAKRIKELYMLDVVDSSSDEEEEEEEELFSEN